MCVCEKHSTAGWGLVLHLTEDFMKILVIMIARQRDEVFVYFTWTVDS